VKEIIGTSNRFIEINLTKKIYKEILISKDERKKFLGGKGLALKLLYERLKPGIDPLSSENIFIIATGILIGTGAPNSARFSAVSKSPLTGIITHSSCGGSFGNALKTSGWDGLIITGRSEEPIFLRIDSSGVEFRNAKKLWGKTTSDTSGLLQKYGKGSMVIGPAGENLVNFANIASDDRFLGRGGLGAVLGSKKIKGIVAEGDEFSINPVDKKTFKKIVKRGFQYIKRNYYTGTAYNKFGTLMYVKSNNRAGILPVNNFSSGTSEKAEQLSGEYISKKFKTKHQSCKNCSILCGHKGDFNGKEMKIPEYESAVLLGSNIGIFDMESIAIWNDICSEMGLDTISTGGTIAYAMEASGQGIIDSPLKFGNSENISETLYDIAYRRNFGAELAMGSKKLSEKYGGKEFAIQVKGLEVAGYDPRGSLGMGLNYAVANRGGCHLSSAIFSLETTLGFIPKNSTLNKAKYVFLFENIISSINSIHTCLFTFYPYILESLRLRYLPKLLLKIVMTLLPGLSKPFLDFSIYSGLFTSVTGIKLSNREFLRAGKRIHILERYMNCREGVNSSHDTLPDKLLLMNKKKGKTKKFPLTKMLKKYYRLRGYNGNGIPDKGTLKKLGIDLNN